MKDYTKIVENYMGSMPEVSILVKSDQEYLISSWLVESQAPQDGIAEFTVLVVKPRLVGPSRLGDWYALMYQDMYVDLIHQAARHSGAEIRVWKREMTGSSVSTHIARNLKLALAHQADSDSTHSCVRIAPKGEGSRTIPYVVTTLAQMSDLLVDAGYGRRDDPPGA